MGREGKLGTCLEGVGEISSGKSEMNAQLAGIGSRPIVILFLTLGLILVVTEGSVLAPFVYSLF